MYCSDPGHVYQLDEAKQQVFFIKRTNGKLTHPGTTNEELLEVLIDRTKFLDEKFPCVENKVALAAMQYALDSFNSRTQKRVAQGVETKNVAHVS